MPIRYVLVWSKWLRIAHWIIAFGVLFQWFSAWAIRHDQVQYEFWRDWHIFSGQIIMLALILRGILLFLPGSGNWRELVPTGSQIPAMVQTLKFYVSFARFPLPNWYAHNPLWKPVYLLVLVIIAGCPATGIFYESANILLGSTPAKLHAGLSTMVIGFAVCHLVAIFLHDLKGKGAFISAMINGHRYFHIDGESSGSHGKSKQSGAVHAPLDQLLNSPGSGNKSGKN